MGFRLAELWVDIVGRTGGLDRALRGVRSQLLGLGAGIGVGAIFKDMIGTATDMEMKLVGLAKATDLDGAGLDKMRDQLFELSTTMKGVAIDDLIAMATAGGKLGIASKDLMAYTRGIAMVSLAAADIPADQLADSIGKINSVFKLSAVEGPQQLGSAMDKVADSGVSSMSGIIEVVQRMSGTAKSIGLTAQESIALSGALLDTGTNAELASTVLMRLMGGLDKMGKLGDNPIEGIKAFLREFDKMSSIQQRGTMKAFGKDSAQLLGEFRKLASVTDTLDTYVGHANDEFKTLNQLTESNRLVSETTGAELIRLQNEYKALGVSIGRDLLPPLNAAMKGLSVVMGGTKETVARIKVEAEEQGIDAPGIGEGAKDYFSNMATYSELAAAHAWVAWQTFLGPFQGSMDGAVDAMKQLGDKTMELAIKQGDVAPLSDEMQRLALFAAAAATGFGSVNEKITSAQAKIAGAMSTRIMAGMAGGPLGLAAGLSTAGVASPKRVYDDEGEGEGEGAAPRISQGTIDQVSRLGTAAAAIVGGAGLLAMGGPAGAFGAVAGARAGGANLAPLLPEATERKTAQITDLKGFADSLLTASMGKGNPQERTAKAAEKHLEVSKATLEVLKKQGLAAASATTGFGFAIAAGPE